MCVCVCVCVCETVPVVDFGLLQLLFLSAVPLFQLHLGLLLPLCLLLTGVGIWDQRSTRSTRRRTRGTGGEMERDGEMNRERDRERMERYSYMDSKAQSFPPLFIRFCFFF